MGWFRVGAASLSDSGIDLFGAFAKLPSFVEGKKDDYVGGLADQVRRLIKEIKPACQVLEEMAEEAVDILTRRLPENVEAK